MLNELFPRAASRYRSLPVLGPITDGFELFLDAQGYRRGSRVVMISTLRRIATLLKQRGHQLEGLSSEALSGCAPADSQANRILCGTVHALQRYLKQQGLLCAASVPPPTPIQTLLETYGAFLRDVRGLAESTQADHLVTARTYLTHLDCEPTAERLSALTLSDIEAFMCWRGPQIGRGMLQHLASQLRGFLRFLASRGTVAPELAQAVDMPRLYRGEQFPRTLPWSIVQAFLQTIDRNTPLGLRDFTMFSLMATYGLRVCEVVGLTLDDIDWRGERLQICQRKTARTLHLPLTEAIGDLLVEYLRDARAEVTLRQLFLRQRAPRGPLKPTAVTRAFQQWRIRSGLAIPAQGPHCLRHAYAVHLLRCGIPIKTIGDVLGHRSAESTCVYLRLAIEDLREVPLALSEEVQR